MAKVFIKIYESITMSNQSQMKTHHTTLRHLISLIRPELSRLPFYRPDLRFITLCVWPISLYCTGFYYPSSCSGQKSHINSSSITTWKNYYSNQFPPMYHRSCSNSLFISGWSDPPRYRTLGLQHSKSDKLSKIILFTI